MNKLPIKTWALDDRPREKLMSNGKLTLSIAELLAIIIGSGNKNESAVHLSKRILQSVENNVDLLASYSVTQLMKFKGVGEAKAVTIIAALELGNRRTLIKNNKKPIIKSSTDAYQILKPLIGSLQHEEFWVLYLNNSNKVLEVHQLSKGGITATMVDIRLLYKKAVELSAVAIIVAHNHPSGKLLPSTSDKQLTQKIKDSGSTLDIKLLDHLIITQKDYFSFADNELL